MKAPNPYDEKYTGRKYYLGKKPSSICNKVIKIMQPHEGFHPKLLDLGCGEGRNAVYFAKYGFEVVGVDLSAAGLEKTRRYAEEIGVHVRTIQADIINYQITGTFDVIFSTGTLQFLPPKVRNERFQNYRVYLT
jgi:tellurite methyltransferase